MRGLHVRGQWLGVSVDDFEEEQIKYSRGNIAIIDGQRGACLAM